MKDYSISGCTQIFPVEILFPVDYIRNSLFDEQILDSIDEMAGYKQHA